MRIKLKCLCDAAPGDVVLDVLLIEVANICSKVKGETLAPVLLPPEPVVELVDHVQEEVLVVLHG